MGPSSTAPLIDERNSLFEKLRVFSTCPSSSQHGDEYLERLIQVARWSETARCTGSLIYTDNSLVDPWLVAQLMIERTRSLCPLVAVQPLYMHPYAVAKMVASLGRLHSRPVFLNMVAGGFKNDLIALNDSTPHDRRYDRLTEYTLIIQQLLDGSRPVSMEGEFYQVKNLTLAPSLAPDLRGGILVSGSSAAGIQAARRLGATAIQYPEPPGKREALPAGVAGGVRLGIIARSTRSEAWTIALERFPEDRKGKITRTLASQISDSEWHKRLAQVSDDLEPEQGPYWLRPFEHYHTNCPYLVGDYAEVAAEVGKYIQLGYRTFILDIPPAEEEFFHTGQVFNAAEAMCTPAASTTAGVQANA